MTAAGLAVADASAVVAALGQVDEFGDWAASVLSSRRLLAPRLMPFEAAGALRRLQLQGRLNALHATAAHTELLELAIDTWPHRPLAYRAWELRDAIAYTDACYVALAEILDVPLVTLDRRLARAPGPRCAFLTPPGA